MQKVVVFGAVPAVALLPVFFGGGETLRAILWCAAMYALFWLVAWAVAAISVPRLAFVVA